MAPPANILSRRLIEDRSEKVPWSGCWIWTGGYDKNGYGQFSIMDRRIRAHVASWMAFYGNNGSLYVLHTCDVTSCVNPFHLFLGTNADNMVDKINKGRQRVARGEASGATKLTEMQAREIMSSKESRIVLSERYGVSRWSIDNLRRKVPRSWRHLCQ